MPLTHSYCSQSNTQTPYISHFSQCFMRPSPRFGADRGGKVQQAKADVALQNPRTAIHRTRCSHEGDGDMRCSHSAAKEHTMNWPYHWQNGQMSPYPWLKICHWPMFNCYLLVFAGSSSFYLQVLCA